MNRHDTPTAPPRVEAPSAQKPLKQRSPTMPNSYLIVIDMQNDFIDGALGTPEAQAIVEAVVERARAFEGCVVFTRDTHGPNYAATQEGRNLPVPHCIKGTQGWELAPALDELQRLLDAPVFDKPSFGSLDLARWLVAQNNAAPIDSIELCGLCTDICVVSNALTIKAHLPEVPLIVNPALCAGVTPAAHDAAIATMACCQVQIL
ncbi:isochorismatase family protein [Collinsella stercoris DSM 13279]|uniref:Isochorismatase family protein n=2 Tax=Collinsella TaxID=102106 RepID=B6G912_9ACTN|nr:isochorismatase family protein [Collinsella stercoris DSM 13279]